MCIVGTSLLYYTRDDESRQQGHISLLGWTVCELPYNRDEPDRWMFEVNQGCMFYYNFSNQTMKHDNFWWNNAYI